MPLDCDEGRVDGDRPMSKTERQEGGREGKAMRRKEGEGYAHVRYMPTALGHVFPALFLFSSQTKEVILGNSFSGGPGVLVVGVDKGGYFW